MKNVVAHRGVHTADRLVEQIQLRLAAHGEDQLHLFPCTLGHLLDALGGTDEHLQGPGGGDFAGGAYQQLTLNLFLSEAEQIQRIDEGLSH